ncbi:MAG: glycosyltransferase family 4 protein [Cyclobacteriaceae bacterium]
MKVLILHQHFKVPHRGGAIRSYYLAKALVEKGAAVVVITAHNEGGCRKENVEGIEVHYLPVPYDNRFGFNKRLAAFFRFVIKSVKFAAPHRDADVCYAISTPLTTGLAALMIRRLYKVPYIFEVGDLWPEAPIEMGFIRNRLFHRPLYKLEKAIYKRAESIVALSPAIRDVIVKKISGKTVHVLPNMSDTDFFKPEEKRAALEEKFGVNGKFVVSYIGAMGVANGLAYILECAKVCQDENVPIHFLLCGDGAMVDELKRSAEELSLRNLTFVPFVNRDGVGEIMNITDAILICYQPVKILETGSPNKYFDGLAAGKLTIINFGGWIKGEVEKEGCGVYVDPKEPGDFLRKVRPFMDDPVLLKKYQDAGRLLAERKYSRRILGEKFWGLVAGSIISNMFIQSVP